jgi:RNA polymerase sigma-70 factor, ECF subfamily
MAELTGDLGTASVQNHDALHESNSSGCAVLIVVPTSCHSTSASKRSLQGDQYLDHAASRVERSHRLADDGAACGICGQFGPFTIVLSSLPEGNVPGSLLGAGKYFSGKPGKNSETPLFNHTESNSPSSVLGAGGPVYFSLPILQFAADGPPDGTTLPGYVSLFVHSEHGVSKRRNQVARLYDDIRPSLMAYLSGLGLSVDEAEDIIQECFLRLVRHLAKKQNEQNLRGWLFRVAHNLTMDLFREGKRYLAVTAEDDSVAFEIVDTSLSPEEIVIKREELRRVSAAMGRLTEQQRYAVLLRAEGLRYREISAVLGMPTQRIGELVQRALARLAGDI